MLGDVVSRTHVSVLADHYATRHLGGRSKHILAGENGREARNFAGAAHQSPWELRVRKSDPYPRQPDASRSCGKHGQRAEMFASEVRVQCSLQGTPHSMECALLQPLIQNNLPAALCGACISCSSQAKTPLEKVIGSIAVRKFVRQMMQCAP